MSNFIKAHGLSIANNGFIENVVVEKLSSTPGSLENGRIYYDSTANELKYVKANGGVATLYTFATKESADAFIASLDATTGATLVGTTGTVGTNGQFSTVDGDVQATIDAIVAAIDAEIKRAKDAESAEATARTSADNTINDTITALKAGSTSTIASLDSTDSALDSRISTLENKVDGDMGDFNLLTTDAKDTLVNAINEVDAHADDNAVAISTEVADREAAVSDLTTYLDTNFLNKTSSTLQSVVADVNMGGNVTIDGDLTVRGGNFVTEAEVVTFADNILTLNSNVTTGAPTEDAGLEVSRGDEGALTILNWNETSDYVSVPVWDATANEGAGAFVQDEIATKSYTESNFLRIEDALTAGTDQLQAELDATQVGAGLGVDGVYTANGASNYIKTATSLKVADNQLDSALKATNDALVQESADRVAGDDALDGRLTTVEGQVNGKIGDLTTLTTDAKDSLVLAINEVDANTDAEKVRAQSAEAAIQGTITALKDGSTSTIKNLDDAIAITNTNLNQEITDRQAAILAEQTARENADSAINSTITALKDGSTLTIKNLDDKIIAETARATGAESEINTNIATMKSNINAMYYTFTAEVAGTTFNIAHNLNSEFINVQVWVYDDSTTKWKNDIVAIEIVDNANLTVYLTESRKVKVIVNKIANLA